MRLRPPESWTVVLPTPSSSALLSEPKVTAPRPRFAVRGRFFADGLANTALDWVEFWPCVRCLRRDAVVVRAVSYAVNVSSNAC